jgi:hypothetical protein
LRGRLTRRRHWPDSADAQADVGAAPGRRTGEQKGQAVPARVRAPAHSTSHGHQLPRRAAAVGHAGNSSSTSKRWLWKRQQTPPVGERRTLATAATVAATTAAGSARAAHGSSHHHGNGGPALRTRRRAESSRLLRWFQHATETGTASSGARGGHRQPVYGERQKVARWRQRPHRGRQLQRTATAADARRAAAPSTRQRRAHSGNGGFPKRHTAARRAAQADRTGNGGTNRAAHRDPDRQRKQRTAEDSLDQTPS